MGTVTIPEILKEVLHIIPEENKPYNGRNISAYITVYTNESSSDLLKDSRLHNQLKKWSQI